MARVVCPGLAASPLTRIRRRRILPVEGEVLVAPGDTLDAEDIVARAALHETFFPINAAATLGLAPRELVPAMTVSQGDTVRRGQIIAQSKTVLGLFHTTLTAPTDGKVVSISPITGLVMIQGPPRQLDLTAYLPGSVSEVIPQSGVELTAEVSLLQGIFGVGGEAIGTLVEVTGDPAIPLDENLVVQAHRDVILYHAGSITGDGLKKALSMGALGLICASAEGTDLFEIVGQALNPAATGNETIGFTLILTEGLGRIAMAPRSLELLNAIKGTRVSVNGTTQIRAGVIRPEVIGPARPDLARETKKRDQVSIGDRVRIVRGKAFGKLGHIREIPIHPQTIGSGARALVFTIDLAQGNQITVPRSNVELLSD